MARALKLKNSNNSKTLDKWFNNVIGGQNNDLKFGKSCTFSNIRAIYILRSSWTDPVNPLTAKYLHGGHFSMGGR